MPVGSGSVGSAPAGAFALAKVDKGKSKNLRTQRMNAAIRASVVPGSVNGGSRSIRVEPGGGGEFRKRSSQSLAKACPSSATVAGGEKSTGGGTARPAGECTTK